VTHFEREIREQPGVLRRVLADDTLSGVGAQLRHAAPSLVLSLARGSSDNAVTFFAYLAGIALGVPVASVPPSLVTVHRAQLLARGAVIVAVSQSGESQDVVQALRALSERGARSLAVTNRPGSSLEQAADLAVTQHAGDERAVAASKTFTSQMMALSRVVAEWADDATLRASLSAVPDAVEALLGDTAALQRAAARLTHAEQLDVLGRGLSFGPALEIALKLKETSYLHAHAYSSAEFQHGPIASLGVGDPLLLLGLPGPTLETTREAAARVGEAGADLTVVASDPRLLELADAAVPLSAGLEPVTEAFVQVVAGQLLALFLATERGLDPDAPRHLNKVTQTR